MNLLEKSTTDKLKCMLAGKVGEIIGFNSRCSIQFERTSNPNVQKLIVTIPFYGEKFYMQSGKIKFKKRGECYIPYLKTNYIWDMNQHIKQTRWTKLFNQEKTLSSGVTVKYESESSLTERMIFSVNLYDPEKYIIQEAKTIDSLLHVIKIVTEGMWLKHSL